VSIDAKCPDALVVIIFSRKKGFDMANSDKLRSLVYSKKVSVLGIGVSNTPLIDMLVRFGARVTAHDKKTRDEIGSLCNDLEAEGVSLRLGEGYLEDIDADVIFKSPGIRFDKDGIPKAVEKGAYLTSEMQVFFELCPAKIIAVTGSDGKTTTTTLISEILKADGKSVFVGGNIGNPLLPVIDEINSNDYVVLELSSFQLHKMTRSPDIAVITNVTPNHLDWHMDMDEYAEAKLNVMNYQSPDSLAVLNYENEVTKEAAKRAKGKVTFFSSARDIEKGVCIKDGVIFYGEDPVLSTDRIIIPGKHNIENYMAAIGALYGIVDNESIRYVASHFKGVEHRIELVRELDGVKYYNSSIDSSPTRTIAALNSFKEKVILLCGGYDKHLDYSPLAPVLCEKTKVVIVTGATKDKIVSALNEYESETEKPDVYLTDCYEDSIKLARGIAGSGDIVLLSPASASFDAFKNFAERGTFFKNKVNEL